MTIVIPDRNQDNYIFLAGETYRKYLIEHLKNYQIPMKGMGIGKQLQYLSNHVSL